MHAFIVIVPFFFFFFFFDCQAVFDVDNVQRRELVNFYGVQRYIRLIIIIISFVCFYIVLFRVFFSLLFSFFSID